MKLTKMFLGEKYIGKFNCDGTRYTKWQKFVRSVKYWTIAVRNVAILVAFVAGFAQLYAYLVPRTVEAQIEIVKEVPMKFEDIPILVKICQAESGSRQFKKNGDVVRGVVNPSDIGYCQINEYINNDLARKLGYDIYTEKGNKEFAVYLFMHRGTDPWNSSKNMWSK